MDVSSVNSASQAVQSTQSVSAQAGVAAVQTTDQRQDFTAQRVVSTQEKSNLEENAARSEEKRFETLKGLAVKLVSGENYYLSDMVFTVYSGNLPSTNQYEIKFTDISTGRIETKSEPEVILLAGGGGSGSIVSGSI